MKHTLSRALGALCGLAMMFGAAAASAQSTTTLASLPSMPGDFADLAGDAIVAPFGSATVFRVTPGGAVIPFGSLTASGDRGVTVGHDGAFYFTRDNRVERIPTTGGASSLFATLPFSNATGITWHPDLDRYLVVDQTHRIYQVTPSGAASVYYTGTPGQAFDSVDYDPSGGAYALTFNTRELITIDTSGPPVATVLATLPPGDTYDVIREASGDYFATSYSNNAVYRVTPAGTVTTFSTSPDLTAPFRIGAVNGQIYVGNLANNSIVILDGLAAGSATAVVPTLTEWAMILFGLGLAGGAAVHLARRHRMV